MKGSVGCSDRKADVHSGYRAQAALEVQAVLMMQVVITEHAQFVLRR